MGRLFGTDGVRGIANELLDCELAFKLGQAGALVLTNEVHKAKIIIGKDTRISGDMLESAMVAGICSVGAEAMIAGVIPTPAIAHLTKSYGADAGVMISASHNTVEYNGIKFFSSDGLKLPDDVEEKIEKIILDNGKITDLPVGINVGKKVVIRNASEEYRDFLHYSTDQRFKGLKLILDCAHGAASHIAPNVFRRLGAEIIPYYNTPDGTNINEKCGSTHPGTLSALVQEMGADLGLAFDGDADRLIAVDERGILVDGDTIMAICAMDMKQRGLLKNNTIVATVMSNLGLELGMKKQGIKVVQTKVGDRYVLEEMIKDGYNFGGEQSGHIIFSDFNTTGDGVLSGIQLISVMRRNHQSLSSLAKCISILPQVLVNAKVPEENKAVYLDDKEIKSMIKSLNKEFHGKGRVLIRPSGTEPLIRVMIEGRNQSEIEKKAYTLAKLIEDKSK
jgi:phosphoglucosamine mutase